MGKRGKRFIPRITTVREWSTGPDGPISPEESTLVIDRLNSGSRYRCNFIVWAFFYAKELKLIQ